MSKQEGKYNIKAVSKRLGIQSGTIRAWERRYKIISPKRNESGHRLYSEEQIEILQWLLNRISEGFTISQAISRFEKEQPFSSPSNNIKDVEMIDYTSAILDELWEALISFNEKKANSIIDKAFSIYSVDKVIYELVYHCILKMSKMKDFGEIISIQENFMISFLRFRLEKLIHMYVVPCKDITQRAIAICAPNETNELSLLMLTYFFRTKGVDVIYIGASVPENEYYDLMKTIEANILLLSCDVVKNIRYTLNVIDELETNDNLKIGVAGNALFEAVYHLNLHRYNKYIIGSDKNEWEEWFNENIGKF